MSTIIRLQEKLTTVVDRLSQLVAGLPINRLQRERGGGVIIAPEFYWGESTAEQLTEQLRLKRDYEQFAELMEVMLHQAPEALIRDFEEADSRLRSWIELEDSWGIRPDQDQNEKQLRKDAAAFDRVLAVFAAGAEVIVVPDTNALLATLDPKGYCQLVGVDSFTFTLIPTVLGELDNLKIAHRNEAVRDKAKKAITRIKGWRKQGTLVDGVTVDKTITIKLLAKEPNMEQSLSWLDPSVLDDRIIANVLSIQAEQPGVRVVLVTGDINLQNKADAALIEIADFD